MVQAKADSTPRSASRFRSRWRYITEYVLLHARGCRKLQLRWGRHSRTKRPSPANDQLGGVFFFILGQRAFSTYPTLLARLSNLKRIPSVGCDNFRSCRQRKANSTLVLNRVCHLKSYRLSRCPAPRACHTRGHAVFPRPRTHPCPPSEHALTVLFGLG